MAGENAYWDEETIDEGIQVDESGNEAQAEAAATGGEDGGGAEVGGDNYTDAGEEAAVENGDF